MYKTDSTKKLNLLFNQISISLIDLPVRRFHLLYTILG